MRARRDGWLLIALSFLLYSALQAPVPGVNEAHYLTKARHYWNPEWCRGDFFLESANAHLVFYQVFGWLTLWLSFAQVAWLGRILSLSLLALGWQALGSRLGLSRTTCLWSAWLFLLLGAIGNFSGEWVVGGFEAKVLAYGLALWGLGYACQRQWTAAAALTGLSVSFHPVVGGWFSIAQCGAIALLWIHRSWRAPAAPEAHPTGDDPPADAAPTAPDAHPTAFWRIVRRSTGLFIVCAAPGLLPALQLISTPSVSATEALDADWVQVFERLGHHLDPMQFGSLRYLGYGLLLVVWIGLQIRDARHSGRNAVDSASPVCPDVIAADAAADSQITTEDAWSYFRAVVWMSVLIALVGIGLGWGPRPAWEMPLFALRTKLLKFYPFRLFDVLLPLAVSLLAARLLGVAVRAKPSRSWLTLLPPLCFMISLFLPVPSRNPSRMSPRVLRDWLETCAWIREHTDPDVLVLTPRSGHAFKWYAQRAEFVSPKDCPQNPRGILEWYHRMRLVRRWEASARNDGEVTREQLQELYDEHNVAFAVYSHFDPLEVPIPAVFENDFYTVHQLPGSGSGTGEPSPSVSEDGRAGAD